MHRLWKALIGVCAAGAVAASVGAASAQEPFYKGKRLTVLINFAPGGGVDINGRLFARYIAKHIEGQPTVIVQNMDGAAGLNGTNYLAQVAPKDGTVLGYLGAIPWQYVTTPERFRVDLRSYEFVAYEPITTIFFVRRDVPPGMKVATDIVKAEGLVSGGLGATHARDLNIRLTLDMLGIPYRHVTGYSSTEKARLAFQRNEINLTGETTPAYRRSIEGLVRAGEALPLFLNPDWNGEALSMPKQAEGLDILQFQELYQRIKGTRPSGPLWDAYLANLALTSTMSRFLVLPPGAPPAAQLALQAAVERVNNDKAFAEETLKSIGYVPEAVTGPHTNRQVRQALNVSPDVRSFVTDYIKRAKK